MKLIHEMEHRPSFGAEFDGNPDSEIRLWIARVSALMSRVSIEKGVAFRSAVQTACYHWVSATNSAQIYVREAIEEIKLELELREGDQIGVVFEANSSFDFGVEISRISQASQSEIFVVDPYFDETAFELFAVSDASVRIRVLLSERSEGMKEFARRFAQDRQRQIEVRKSKVIHDRTIFVDQADCWIIGASVKDGGRKPTFLMPVPQNLAIKKLEIYEGIWSDAR